MQEIGFKKKEKRSSKKNPPSDTRLREVGRKITCLYMTKNLPVRKRGRLQDKEIRLGKKRDSELNGKG